MKCRCGHGPAKHWPTANAYQKRRARGDHRPPKRPCHAADMSTYKPRYGALECKCRGWHPEESK